MDKIIEKIGSYNIFNHLIPGTVFVILLKFFVNIDIVQKDLITGVLLYYFIGIVVNGIGSIAVEWFFKQIKIIKHESYERYVEAEKLDPKIQMLQEVSNMHRGLVAACLLIILSYLIKKTGLWEIHQARIALQLLGMMLLVTLLSSYYVKQTNYVVRRVVKAIQDKEKESR